jgi:hypothetical protein
MKAAAPRAAGSSPGSGGKGSASILAQDAGVPTSAIGGRGGIGAGGTGSFGNAGGAGGFQMPGSAGAGASGSAAPSSDAGPSPQDGGPEDDGGALRH